MRMHMPSVSDIVFNIMHTYTWKLNNLILNHCSFHLAWRMINSNKKDDTYLQKEDINFFRSIESFENFPIQASESHIKATHTSWAKGKSKNWRVSYSSILEPQPTTTRMRFIYPYLLLSRVTLKFSVWVRKFTHQIRWITVTQIEMGNSWLKLSVRFSLEHLMVNG